MQYALVSKVTGSFVLKNSRANLISQTYHITIAQRSRIKYSDKSPYIDISP
jgi:hypothetical protein